MSLSAWERKARLPFTFLEGDVLTMEGFMRGVHVLDEIGDPDRDGDQAGGFSDVPIFAVALISRWKVSPNVVKAERAGKVVYERAAVPTEGEE